MNPVLGMGRLLKGWIVNSREKLVLGLTVVIVVVDVLELSAAIQDARAARREYLDNAIILTRVLWQQNDKTSRTCLAACAADVRCASFFYNKATGVCQGHSVTFGQNKETAKQDLNTKYFVREFGEEYIGDSCTNTADCVTANSECRNETCSCKPGYSFFPSQHTCTPNCTVYGPDFMAIPEHYIARNNVEAFTNTTVSDCQRMCLNRTSYVCVTVEFTPINNKCNLQNVTVLDVDAADWWWDDIHEFNVTYYQRDCLE